MRRLKSSYSGPGIKLRRASDSTTQDINFLGFTGFSGAPLDVAAAASFCAATTCTIDTWYDQSGLARHLTQATAGLQPQYVANCIGAQPCLEVTAAGQYLGSASQTPVMPTTFGAVANRVSGSGGCSWGIEAGTADQGWGAFGFAADNWQLRAAFVASAADNAWHAGLAVLAGAASLIRIDATETTGSATGGLAAGQYLAPYGIAATICRMAENLRWDGYVLTPAERAALTDNQRSFWGF